jgi:hypothetical protein
MAQHIQIRMILEMTDYSILAFLRIRAPSSTNNTPLFHQCDGFYASNAFSTTFPSYPLITQQPPSSSITRATSTIPSSVAD